jgi:hypothetical protein
MTPDTVLAPPAPLPKVFFWFKVYCAVLCALYAVVAAVGVFILTLEPAELDMPAAASIAYGVLMLLLGLVFFVASLLPFLLRPRPWVWVYDLVIICIGMTSACFLPACVPLLIFWIKPEVKAHFGRV